MILSVVRVRCSWHGLLTSFSNLTLSTRQQRCQTLRFTSNMCFDDIYVALSRKSLRITPFAECDLVGPKTDIESNEVADEFDSVKSFFILTPVTSPGDKNRYISECICCFDVGKTARQFGAKTYHAARIEETGGVLKRVLCVAMRDQEDTDKNIKDIVSSHCMKTYEKIVRAENGSSGIHQVFDGTSQKIIMEKKCNLKVVNNVSPFFAERKFGAIFYDFQSVQDFLLKCFHIPEVQELLEITNRLVPPSVADPNEAKLAHPFVVVEGMDATGKTTLTKELESRMKATRYSSPPPCLLHLRKFFDDFPEIIRRAYYSVGNYIVAQQIIETCKTNAVIMDRFWHSSAAYAITNETSVSDMPTRGHWVYDWPDDLLRPTIVLFLTVSEEIRKSRIANRPEEKTVEEKVLDADMVFRQRLCESYKRMRNPECVEIDAGGNVESVVQAACAKLTNDGITLN